MWSTVQGLSLTTKNIILVEDDSMYSVQFNYVEVTSECRLTPSRKHTDSCPFSGTIWYLFHTLCLFIFTIGMPPTRDVKMNLPQSSGLETSPPKTSLEWKAWGSPEWEQGRTLGGRVGEASKHPLLLFSASMDTVPGIRGTNLVPLVTHLQARCSQMLTVITQSWSSGYPILKKRKYECRVNPPSTLLGW